MIKEYYVWIEDKYIGMFELAGLTGFDDISDGTFGRLIRKESEKKIRFFTIGKPDSSLGFYVKQERPQVFYLCEVFFEKQTIISIENVA